MPSTKGISRTRLFISLVVAVVATLFPASASAARCVAPRGTHAAPVLAAGHPRILVSNAATLACLKQHLAEGTRPAMRFKALVDSELDRSTDPGYVWGVPESYEFKAWYAALMFRVTSDPAYADFAVRFADAVVAREEARINGGQNPEVAHDSYLYVGDLVGDVAITYDWTYEQLTAGQRARWIAYMNQSVANVWDPNGATWNGRPEPWSGWSVDNPSNNYYYSFLRATMLLGLATLGENPQAQQWIDQFRTAKIGGQLIPTFQRDLPGGGSREGTGYGTAMRSLFTLYDWWERSTGERIADLTPHAEESLGWMTHAIVPTLDRIAAIGDHARDSSASLFDYHREYLLTLISLYSDRRAATLAADVLEASSVPEMTAGFQRVADYLYEPPVLPTAPTTDASTTYYGSGTGQLFMRSTWGDAKAAYSAFSCGPYTESHAHQDQGAFQIFRGEWLAPTGNIYSHGGIQQSAAFNNLVRFTTAGDAPIPQVVEANGSCELRALADTPQYTFASARVTPAYDGNPAVQKVEREYLFLKPSTFVVFDRVASAAGSHRIWTLNLPGQPTIDGDHLTYSGVEQSADRLDVYRAAPAGRSYSVNDPDYSDGGDTALAGTAAKRVDVVDSTGTESRFLHVIGTSTTGASPVSSVSRSDAAGETGVMIALADGRTATVRFSDAGTGGTLAIEEPGGPAAVAAPLPSTVVTPPLFASPESGAGVTPPPAGPSTTQKPSPSPPPTPTATPDVPIAATGRPSTPGQPGTVTPPTSGASPSAEDLALAVGPTRRGRHLTVRGVRVRPTKAGRCPRRGQFIVAKAGKTVLRATVMVSRDGLLCRVTTRTVRLPRVTGAISVRIAGPGLRSRRWTLRAV